MDQQTVVLPDNLPQVIDVLVVGGGPAGTGAAFRASELGLSVLVIDRDEVLGILKELLGPGKETIDSSYGAGGDNVPFPAGDALIESLRFADKTKITEVYDRWLGHYKNRPIPHANGLELANLERGADGIWSAHCVHQSRGERPTLRARAIVFSMGRGVPVKLNVSGDPTGINYKTGDLEKYVGGPACVIGGGTSAAEAVIAISNAKAAANDESDVYWSYRRRKLPKVNATLAKDFFSALRKNGNISYLPFSVPLAILMDEEGREFMALRSDYRRNDKEPNQATYLEFEKTRLLACIGADLPVGFLKSVGIERLNFSDGDDTEELMAVKPTLESVLPGIYMVGDLLSPAFIQTTDFSADAVQSTVIDHVGNFKNGIRDGALAAEAIKKRIDGMDDAQIYAFLEQKNREYSQKHALWQQGALPGAPAPAPKVEAPPPVAPVPQMGARFAVLGPDGVNATEHFISPGRSTPIRTFFPNDPALAANEAVLVVEPDSAYVSDESRRGETFVGMHAERTVRQGDLVVAGKSTMRVDTNQGSPALAVLDGKGGITKWLTVEAQEQFYGRDSVDTSDLRLSRRHFSTVRDGSVVRLRDAGSTNGIFLRVKGAVRLNSEDEIVVGARRLRFIGLETGGGTAPVAVQAPPVAAAVQQPSSVAPPAAQPLVSPPQQAAPPQAVPSGQPAAPPPQAPAAASASGPPSALVQPMGIQLTLTEDQTLLDGLMEEGMAASDPAELIGNCQNLWECGVGRCGLCVVEVLSGDENLGSVSSKEKRTLKGSAQRVGLPQEKCRLACVAKATGPVTIKLLGNTEG